MTRDIRIALLIGLAFITLFGIVLGQRSLRLSDAGASETPLAETSRDRPGPEVAAIAVQRDDDRPVLSPRRPVASAAHRGAEISTDVASADRAGRGPVESLEVGYAPDLPPAERFPPIMVAESAPAPQPTSVRPAPVRPTPAVRVEVVDGPDPAPAAALARTYRVQPGDSLRKIARTVYGADREDRYVLIYAANKQKLRDAHTVIVGDVLTIPPLAGAPAPAVRSPATPSPAAGMHASYLETSIGELGEAIRRAAPPAPVRKIVVRKGDNLTRIAEREMGAGSRTNVLKLIDANKDRLNDPDRLVLGMKLRIPR